MTIAISGGLISEPDTITDNTRTTVFTAERRTLIASIMVCPTTGTPAISISRYDGTTRTYFRRSITPTAGTPVVYDTPFTLDPAGVIEVQSDAVGGALDVLVTYVNPVAPATVRTST
jgi:hypothetical protein